MNSRTHFESCRETEGDTEDQVNKLKMGYGGKPWVRRLIPMRLRGVRGYWVWSEWFTNDEKIELTNALHSTRR